MNKPFYILLLLTCNYACFAQLPSDLHFTNYTSKDGLPNDHINSITQDSRGFMWIGSEEGLFRFDGKNFKAWYADKHDSTKFASNYITVFEEYQPNKILFASYNRLWQIDIRNQKIEPIASFRNKKFIHSPVKIFNNQWCIATSDSVFFTTNKLQTQWGFRVSDYFTPNMEVIAYPLYYPYLILQANGVSNFYFCNIVSKEFKPLSIDKSKIDIRANEFKPLGYDSTIKRLYIATYFEGGHYIDIDIQNKNHYTIKPIQGLQVGGIQNGTLINPSLLMMGHEGGIIFCNFTERKYYNGGVSMDKPTLSGKVNQIYKGKNEIYWAATSQGLSKFSLKPDKINYWQNEFGIKGEDYVKTITKVDNNTIYILFGQNGLYKLNTATKNEPLHPLSITYGKWWWGNIFYNNKLLLYGGDDKLREIDLANSNTIAPDYLKKYYPPQSDLVTLVYRCKNGDMWYSMNVGGGLLHFDAANNIYTQYTNNTNPPAISLRYAINSAEDSKGNIWFSTNRSHMLVRWNQALKKFDEFSTGELVAAYKNPAGVNNLYFDEEDNLWVTLDRAGVIKYNPFTKKGDYFDLNRGLPTSFAGSVVVDNKKRAWIATAKGLACYIPESDKIVVFTTNDGLPVNEMEGCDMLYDKATNVLYAGGINSVAYFTPDSLLQNVYKAKPQVYIEEMMVNGKPFLFESENNIQLNPDENNISFAFSVADFERHDQLEFEYQLSGNSAAWVSLRDKRSVTFNDLKSGRYILKVRTKYKGAAQWNETAQPFYFTIKTPWYKTKWFIALVALNFIFLIWFLIQQFYRRKMEKQQAILEKEIAIEQERTKMARELHDGLGSMLSGIRHSFTAMKNEFKLDEKQQLLFHTNMDKLNESIIELRHISHNMASDALVQFGLENSLRDYCFNLSNTTGLQIVFNSLNCENSKQDEVKNMHLFRAVQELLQNIIKHAGAKEAMVQLSHNNNTLYITVEDDGKGFNMQEAKKQKSMGLKNIEARIKLLKGNLDYQTNTGKGTSVLITVPA